MARFPPAVVAGVGPDVTVAGEPGGPPVARALWSPAPVPAAPGRPAYPPTAMPLSALALGGAGAGGGGGGGVAGGGGGCRGGAADMGGGGVGGVGAPAAGRCRPADRGGTVARYRVHSGRRGRRGGRRCPGGRLEHHGRHPPD